MKLWSGSFIKGISVETTGYVGDGQHWNHFIGHIREVKILGISYLYTHTHIHTLFFS